MIFDQYVNTDLGANGIAKYLENHGIHKIARQNGKNPLFDAALIRRIIQNPVYSGKISYGRRRTEKVHGTRNEYRQVKKDDYLLVDGLHEALVSEEVWEQAQVKVAAQAKKYEKVNRDKREKIHLLSGILKCPVCGAGMYGNKSIKKRKDGSNYKDFYYYGCKHRNMTRGHKCDYKKQVHEEMLDASVAEVISKLVSNPKFSDLIRNKINMEVDTSALDQEIENYKIQLRKLYHNKDTILSDMDSLDYEDKHYQRRKTDLENHLYKTYDKIDDAEELLVSAKAKKRSLLADKITGDNIYKALVFFDKLYAQMNEGYVAKDYYLEFSEDLGKPIKIEEDTTVESDTFEGLADGIREIERLQDKLIQREKQLAVLEDKIKRENQDYEDKYNNENVAKLRAFDERDTAKKELQEILKDYYVDIKSILSKVHYHEYQYMDKVGKKDLILMIEKEYELGRLLGKTSKEVSLELGCYLIGIYDYFQEYSKSFDVMLVMAELSDYWVDLETATLNWANKEHILYKLYNEIERALVNYRVKNERRKNFEGYLQTIKKIRGVLTMENNNNLTQENRAFKKEDAYETLGIINTWIGNMDTKVSFALALAGVLIGVIFEKGLPRAFHRITEVSRLAELSGGEIIATILVALLYLASFISILCFMLSIIARVKNLNNSPSIFFFGSIGSMTLENYKNAVKDMNEREIVDDLEEQIHTNSKICSLKAKWYSKGIKFLLATVILWFVCMIFQLI